MPPCRLVPHSVTCTALSALTIAKRWSSFSLRSKDAPTFPTDLLTLQKEASMLLCFPGPIRGAWLGLTFRLCRISRRWERQLAWRGPYRSRSCSRRAPVVSKGPAMAVMMLFGLKVSVSVPGLVSDRLGPTRGSYFKVNFCPVTAGAADLAFLFGFPHMAHTVGWLVGVRKMGTYPTGLPSSLYEHWRG